jgi:hypothetical protein
MSTLKADTIVAADGTSPVTLTKQDAAKAWVVYDQSANTVRNSLNVSSIGDTATGDFLRNHASSFSDAYYTNTGGGSYHGSEGVTDDSLGHRHATSTTSSVAMKTTYGGAGLTALDWQSNEIVSHGDLA